MIASVHIADVGTRSALALLRKAPTPSSTPGLRFAKVALAGALSGSFVPSPTLGRVGLIAFWDDDDALDQFLADHKQADRLGGGWQARLAPLRVFGTWPGFPDDVSRDRHVAHDGPVAVLTLGRLRLRRAVSFLRTSAKAEATALHADGMTWATGMARPPFVSTLSLWESTDALSAWAYGDGGQAHPAAIAADRAKPFHRQSAFVRFRPYRMEGQLEGKNPLTAAIWTAR
jgi:hypothetical protein